MSGSTNKNMSTNPLMQAIKRVTSGITTRAQREKQEMAIKAIDQLKKAIANFTHQKRKEALNAIVEAYDLLVRAGANKTLLKAVSDLIVKASIRPNQKEEQQLSNLARECRTTILLLSDLAKSQTPVCKNCNKPGRFDDVFCKHCGTQLFS